MAKIEKLPSGLYRIRVYDKRTKKQKSLTAATKAELKLKEAEYLCKNDPSRDMTVKEAVSEYIEDRSAVLSPSSLRGYSQMVHYLEPIENYSAKDIKSEDLQRFVNDLAKERSPKTVRNVYGLVSASLRAFYPNKPISVRLPQKQPKEKLVPTTETVRALLELAGPELKKAILLAACGTMRRGEISALTYGDIEGNTIHVHADVVKDANNKWVLKPTPKTSGSDRYIEYPKGVIEALGTGEPDQRVVDFINPDRITRTFTIVRDKLGLKCRFHDLRGYAASIMHALNIPDEYIKSRGGWTSTQTLHNFYRATLEDEARKNTDRINDHMAEELGRTL